MFRSLPFALMLGVLAVAITICTINRIPGMWQSIAHPTIPTTHGFLRSAELNLTTTASAPRQELPARSAKHCHHGDIAFSPPT